MIVDDVLFPGDLDGLSRAARPYDFRSLDCMRRSTCWRLANAPAATASWASLARRSICAKGRPTISNSTPAC